MAGRANSLTEHATKTAAGGTRFTSPSSDLRVLVDALAGLGHDRAALMASAGLRGADLEDPDKRFPCDVYGGILERAQRTRFTPNLALEIATRTTIGAYPLLDYLILTSETVGAGLRQLARYFSLVASPVVVTLRERDDPIRVEADAVNVPFAVEYFAALMVLHLRTETEGRISGLRVSFRHVPDDAAAFERALGCPVQPAAAWSGVSVPRDGWALPFRRRDPVLRRMLEQQADAMLARVPAQAGLAREVQRALIAAVGQGGDTRVETIARALALSGRTLQRRLAAEGTSYQQLLDDIRKDAAGRHLAESALAIGEVAYLIGYSEPAPFHRAFKRWYATTPEAYRRNARERR